jgi:hypothetical protein
MMSSFPQLRLRTPSPPEAGLLTTIIRPQWLQMAKTELRIITCATIPEYPIRQMLNFFLRSLLRYVNPTFMMRFPRERFASGICSDMPFRYRLISAELVHHGDIEANTEEISRELSCC